MCHLSRFCKSHQNLKTNLEPWIFQLFMDAFLFCCGSMLRFPCGYTLQGTNISPKTGILKMMFLFPRWDMLVPWRVTNFYPPQQKNRRDFPADCRNPICAFRCSWPNGGAWPVRGTSHGGGWHETNAPIISSDPRPIEDEHRITWILEGLEDVFFFWDGVQPKPGRCKVYKS